MKKNLLLTAMMLFLFVLRSHSQCACNVPAFVAASQTVGTSAGVNIPKPAGVQPGHLMIAAVHVGWCNSGSVVTPPAGWTLINHTSNTGSGCGSSNTTKQLATFYKIATNAEPLSYSFTATSNQWYVGGIVAYSGANTVTPIHVNSNNGAQDLCASIVASGVTTSVSCTRLVGVFFCSVNSSATNIIPPGSMTERFDMGTTGNHPWGNENLEVSDEAYNLMGATGNRTAALTGCSSNGWVTGAQLIAILPANAGSNPTITVNSGSICAGSNFTLNPNGASSYTFQGGSAVVSPTANATYTVVGSTGTCVSNVVTATVNVSAAPNVTTATSNSLICVGQSATLTAGGANTYTWNTSATGSVVVVSPTVSTTYTVTGTDLNGCTKVTSITQSVSTCAGISTAPDVTKEFEVYPNPNNGIFNVQLKTNAKVEISNSLGQIIIGENKVSGLHNIDLRKQADGVYFVRITAGERSIQYKVIKE